MYKQLEAFIDRHDSFILTTHDPADADGLGAQLIFAAILREKRKQFRIINASPLPEQFRFMDHGGLVECWDPEIHGGLAGQCGLFILDTADDNHIGAVKDAFVKAREVFVLDHHEPMSHAPYSGIYDSTVASTSELAVELAVAGGVTIDPRAAAAAYTGIVYDSGFFAYPKTGPRTFRAALVLTERGANPNEAYKQLRENASTAAILLRKKALGSFSLHYRGKVAAQILCHDDFTETGATGNDTDGLVNIPLASREIAVSILVKESRVGKIRCSMRSKGAINVAKIAQGFGGGGHVNAAGFSGGESPARVLEKTLAMFEGILEA